MDTNTTNYGLDLDLNNTTTASPTNEAAAPLMRLIPHKVYNELIIVWPLSWLVILPLGLVANGLNIRTFFRMGLDESVTISFFVLALSDFAQLFVPLANIVVMFLLYVEKKFSVYFEVQPLALFTYVVNMAALFNTLTSLITAFLAVQRCLCIALPFHFRGMFTEAKTWCLMAFFAVYSAAPAFAYLFATYELKPLTRVDGSQSQSSSSSSSSGVRTQMVLALTKNYVYVQKYADILIFTGTSVACLVLNIGSLFVMTYSLAASIRFRRSATTVGVNNNKSRLERRVGGAANDINENSETAGQTTVGAAGGRVEGKQTSKERTAIVQVALLSAIYLVTSLPKIGFSICSRTVPGFGHNQPLNNLYIFGGFLRVTFDYLNSAVNFFVYFKYNSQFRKLCFASPDSKRAVT